VSSRAALTAVIAIALAAPAASASARPDHGPTATAARCKTVTIGGHKTCLAVGRSCQHKYQKQYVRYGFSCARNASGSWRLAKPKQSF
jgi:uncharacterized membrane protein